MIGLPKIIFFRFQKLDFPYNKNTFCRLQNAQSIIFKALGRFSAITSVSNQGRIGVNFGAFVALGRTMSRNSKKRSSATNIVVWALSSTLERPENSLFLTLSRTRFLLESGAQGAETLIYKSTWALPKIRINFSRSIFEVRKNNQKSNKITKNSTTVLVTATFACKNVRNQY